VTVIVKARDNGGRTAAGCQGESHFVTVNLREPVGGRVVIDGTNLVGLVGHVIPRVP